VREVSRRCLEQYGLRRDQLWLNSSHTHSGPAVWPNLRVIFDFNALDQQRAEQYAHELTDKLIAIVGAVLEHQQPATLSFGMGDASFAINRRLAKLQELHPGQNFPAPIDHSVPVIQVKSADGVVRAILFGYACHNTTITGEFYEVAGDYAGYAQEALERQFPQAQAMFVELCGGDQNPSPRSKVELARVHGDEMAAAVESVLAKPLKSLSGPIKTAFETTVLPFTPYRREDFETEEHSVDVYHRRRAKLMLAAYEHGEPPSAVDSYPVQAIRFGAGPTILTLGGEVVVDYDLRVKREYAGSDLVVAGYSNGVMSYIPSERVLKEGGYEAADSMIYYAQPAPYATGIEERIFNTIHDTLQKVGIQPAARRSSP
jgi:neutral ceramidase